MMPPAVGLSVVVVRMRLVKSGLEGTHVLPLKDKLNLMSPKVTDPPAENKSFLKSFSLKSVVILSQ